MEQIREIMRVKDIRSKLLYMLGVMLIVRFGSQVPVYGTDPSYLQKILENTDFNLLDMFSGGSFSNMSIFALSITPYITASIIIQLLTIAIPALEELSEDGETGRQKLNDYTRYLAAALALMESIAMCVGFSRQGVFTGGTLAIITAVVTLTAGAVYLMWLGEQCTEHGIGNGVSFILLVNILSRVPQMLSSCYEQFIAGKKPAWGILVAVIIVGLLIGVTAFVVVLDGAVRNIPVINSRKISISSQFIKGGAQPMPLKVNTSGVIAVIFASSILSFPGIIASFAGKTSEWTWLAYLNQNNWFSLTRPIYTIGAVLYCALVVFFAYFYTDIQLNPRLIADNLKKRGSVIQGVKPGAPTEEYLRTVISHIIPIGAIGLLIVCLLPIVINGVTGANISFGGTSLIIVAGVIVEFVKQLQGMMTTRGRKGFLSDIG